MTQKSEQIANSAAIFSGVLRAPVPPVVSGVPRFTPSRLPEAALHQGAPQSLVWLADGVLDGCHAMVWACRWRPPVPESTQRAALARPGAGSHGGDVSCVQCSAAGLLRHGRFDLSVPFR